MKRTQWLQETRLMRFEEAYEGYAYKRPAQDEAASLLGGVAVVHFAVISTAITNGFWQGDRRVNALSARCAPVDEVMALTGLYTSHYHG